MSLLSLLTLCLLCFACASTASAVDASPGPPPPRIWSSVVFATNNPHPGEPPEHLRKYAGKLKNIFGYNQFEIVGESSDKMGDPNERWLAPSKDFSLSVKSRTAPGERNPTHVALFQGNRRLAEFETHLTADSPLFIRGPLYGRGQLVIVVHVADPSEMAEPHAVRTPFAAINPGPVPAAAIPREKERLNPPPPALAKVQKEPFRPIPPERFGPSFGPSFGPTPLGHFGPLRDERPGGFDQKLPRP